MEEEEDEEEPMVQSLFEDFNASDNEIGPASPGAGPGTPKMEDGPELELPDAKRNRMSRLTIIQNLCNTEQLKSRNGISEIIR